MRLDRVGEKARELNKSAANRSRKALTKIRIQNAEAKGQKLNNVQICPDVGKFGHDILQTPTSSVNFRST